MLLVVLTFRFFNAAEIFFMKTLRIIGSGIKGIMHFTQESKVHLQAAKKTLWLGTIDGLDQLLLNNNLLGEDITFCYQNQALDSDNYSRIKEKVLDELAKHHDIALVVLGHPRLGVTIVQEFQQAADQHDFTLYVLPGISSFDAMINDLQVDPIEEGACLLDANRLILYDYHMEPCINYFIYHICSIGNSNTDYESPSERNACYFLREKLLKHFPGDHEAMLVSSSSMANDKSFMCKQEIQHLDKLLEKVTFDSSLYIPAMLPNATKINKEFYYYITNEQLKL